jgi:hypothetical protein
MFISHDSGFDQNVIVSYMKHGNSFITGECLSSGPQRVLNETVEVLFQVDRNHIIRQNESSFGCESHHHLQHNHQMILPFKLSDYKVDETLSS